MSGSSSPFDILYDILKKKRFYTDQYDVSIILKISMILEKQGFSSRFLFIQVCFYISFNWHEVFSDSLFSWLES